MHIPVLKKEVLFYLDPKPNENFVDATIGQAGHTRAILPKVRPRGRVLGIELDPALYWKLKNERIERLILANASYVKLAEVVNKYNFRPVHGILFDLGMSRWHLEESGRGFSFQKDELLDMRYSDIKEQMTSVRRGSDEGQTLSAVRIVNEWSEKEIEKILKDYGQERFSRRIARKMIEARGEAPIKTTFQLVEIIKKAVPKKYQSKNRHPATKTFQALRIAVNNELETLKKGLAAASEVLALNKGGRLVVISFHSLEDRIVKNFFREQAAKGFWRVLTKKPVVPSVGEVQENPASRSAKLRAAVKI